MGSILCFFVQGKDLFTSTTGQQLRSLPTTMNKVAGEPRQRPFPGRTWQENFRGRCMRPEDGGIIAKKAISFQEIIFTIMG